MLLVGITNIKAREQSDKLTLSDYPRMDQEDRKRYHKHVFELAFPHYKAKSHTMKDAINKLKQGR